MPLGDFLGSPYYWTFVVVLTVSFSVVDFFALDPRELGRKQGWAVAIYVGTWGIVMGLSLPVAPIGSTWWVFPWAFRIAVAIAIIGGHVLAGSFRAEQKHRHERHPHEG